MSPFSAQTIAALTEVITGGSANTGTPVIGLYRTGTDLVNFFRHLGHTISIGSRVPSVRRLLDELHARTDGETVLTPSSSRRPTRATFSMIPVGTPPCWST